MGLSDHTGENYTSFAALGKGVSIIEKHFIDSKKRKGPDISASIDKNQLRDLILGSREIHKSLPGKVKPVKSEKNTANFAFASVVSNENIKVCTARCFAFVGKYLPLNSNYVIGNFIKSILDNKSIEAKSKIKVTRTYMHAHDLAECLIKLAFNNSTNFTTYNIGSDNIIDIHSLARKLSKKYKIKNINQKNISKKDYDRYVPSISKFRKKFQFKKQLNSYNAIIKTIKEFKQNK